MGRKRRKKSRKVTGYTVFEKPSFRKKFTIISTFTSRRAARSFVAWSRRNIGRDSNYKIVKERKVWPRGVLHSSSKSAREVFR